MGDQWYYSRGGKQGGPVSAAQLKQLAYTGQVSPTDLLWKEGLGDWIPAAKVKGLFGAQPVASASPSSEPARIGGDPAVRPAQTQPVPPASPMYQFAKDGGEGRGPGLRQTNPLKAPAISLIVVGAILALVSLFNALMALGLPQSHMFMGGDAAAKLMVLKALLTLYGIVSIGLSGMVIVGAIAMLKQSSYGLSIAGAISAIVGGVLILLLAFVLAVPVGIWALIVLRKPEGKRLFTKG